MEVWRADSQHDDDVCGLVRLEAQLWSLTGALMLVVDESDRIVAANPAMCTSVGLAEVELIGRDAVEVVVPREVADFRYELRSASRSGVPSTCEHELRTPAEDERRVVAWSMSRTSRTPVLVGCIGVDVTAARKDSDMLRGAFRHRRVDWVGQPVGPSRSSGADGGQRRVGGVL